MAPAPSRLDWSLVQTYLAVVEHGSLSKAARFLGQSQPTLGRKIKELEDQLGSELFRRHEKGLTPTEAGQDLLGAARSMQTAAHELELRAAGGAERLKGTVRLTASVAVATHHLPSIIAKIRRTEPWLAIELDPRDDTSKLHFREADIAIRMYRPTQLDLIASHIGDLSFAAFAARSYVERRGLPKTRAELIEHDVVGLDRSPILIQGFERAGFAVDRDWFKVRCDDYSAHFALVKAGCGIGFMQRAIGARDPELVELEIDFGIPSLPVWLTAHDVIRKTPRVARVWDILAEELRLICDR